jgi:hypothetical protein
MMGPGGWPKPNWRSKGNISPRAQPNELERSKHRATQALKYISGLDGYDRPLSFKERTLIEIGLHAAHADEAMQKDEVDRAQDHIDQMNALARQIRSASAPAEPAPAEPAIEVPTDPERVVAVETARDPFPSMTPEQEQRAIMAQAEQAFLARSRASVEMQDEEPTEPERALTTELASEAARATRGEP